MTRLVNTQGMSLVEVLSSLAIFAVIAAGTTASTISTIRGNTASRDTSAASALIHDKVEQLRALDPVANPADLTAGVHQDARNPMTELGQAGGQYRRSWTVTRNSPRQGLAVVKVTVTWSDPTNRSLTSATYVCLSATCA